MRIGSSLNFACWGLVPLTLFTRLSHWLRSHRLYRWRQCGESCHRSKIWLIIPLRSTSIILVIRLITIVLLWWIKGIVGFFLVCHHMGFSFFFLRNLLFGIWNFNLALLYPRFFHFSDWDYVREILVGIPYHPVIIRRCRRPILSGLLISS